MQDFATEVLERFAAHPAQVTIVTERNKCGTWGVAAYYERDDGARDRRLLATCETQKDAAQALRNAWAALGSW